MHYCVHGHYHGSILPPYYLLPIEVGANSGAAKCDPTVFDIDTSRPAGLFGLTAHLYIYTTARGGMGDALLVVVVSTAASAVLVRIVSLIMSIRKCRASRRGDEKCVQPVKTALKTMVVLGSGGHTTEMIRLVEQLDPTRYSPLVYVVAESDMTSITRVRRHASKNVSQWRDRFPFEEIGHEETEEASSRRQMVVNVHRLPRAREVHQSYVSSIFTTLQSLIYTLCLIWKIKPQLLLVNGPGTCVPVVYSAFIFRVLALGICKVVFVESLCRVQTLSLTGKLVYHIVDAFVVQWPSLKRKYPMVEVSDAIRGSKEWREN